MDLTALERVGTALADPTRRQILARLADGPAYPGDLADALVTTPANISNHLACLRGCGLVTATPEGRRVRYDLADARLAAALRQLAAAVHAIEPGHRHHPPLDHRHAYDRPGSATAPSVHPTSPGEVICTESSSAPAGVPR